MNSYPSSPVDILIIIALKEEFDYFIDALGLRPAPLLSTPSTYKFTLNTAGQRQVTCAVGYVGKMGVSYILPFAMKQIEKLQPSLVVNIGISGLIDDDLHIGDVIMAERADELLYRSKVFANPAAEGETINIPSSEESGVDFNQIQLGGDPLNASPYSEWFLHAEDAQPTKWVEWVHKSIEQLNGGVDIKRQQTLKEQSLISPPPKLHVGPVVTGPWVGASTELKRWLQRHDRNYLAMDVESWGVLKAVRDTLPETKTLIIRGISDPSDFRKKALDQMLNGFNRNWAMNNASRLFALFVETYWGDVNKLKSSIPKPTKQELADTIHKNCIERFLDYPFNSSPSSDVLVSYSRFFSLICGSKASNTFFSELSTLILKSINNVPLHVEGYPGCGKTSLLSLLYWCLWDKYLQDDSNPLPIFINLHYYNLILKDIEPYDEIPDKMAMVIKTHFEPLKYFTANDPDHPLIIIIDGYDEFSLNKDTILASLYDVVEPVKFYKIIGSRENSNAFYRKLNHPLPLSTKTLQSIEVSSSAFDETIDSFALIYKSSHGVSMEHHELKQKISSTVKSFGLKAVDLFDLSMIADYQVSGSSAPEVLPDLLELFCTRFISQRIGGGNYSELLSRAATIAFDLQIRDLRPKLRSKQDIVLWELVQKHNRISEFLTAYHIIVEFIKTTDLDIDRLNRISYVYQHRINRMAKEILNARPEREFDFLRSFEELVNERKIDKNTKAQACYLAGRIKNPRYKELAQAALFHFKEGSIRILTDRKPEPVVRVETSSSDLLLTRTVYISLAYLGDVNALDEYVEILLNNSTMDTINRGFHLEYYGDQFYDHRTPLTNVDRLGPCPATFSKLIQNLEQGPANNPLFEIELVTLCSLAQKRHISDRLRDDDREQLVKLLDHVQSNDFPIRTELVRSYMRMVRRDLSIKPFYVSSVFERYYQIKSTKREGWRIRGIENAESVADHTFGAYLIALFFLPDTLPSNVMEVGGEQYSKDHIIKMLLVHDLAESVTGDILPRLKNETSEAEERDVYEEIALSGTYRIADRKIWLADLETVRVLWEEFENRSTYNARVAKDIDKLENLAQLAVYSRHYNINDLKDWRRGLRRDIKTSLGKEIMQMLEPMFNSVSMTNNHE